MENLWKTTTSNTILLWLVIVMKNAWIAKSLLETLLKLWLERASHGITKKCCFEIVGFLRQSETCEMLSFLVIVIIITFHVCVPTNTKANNCLV